MKYARWLFVVPMLFGSRALADVRTVGSAGPYASVQAAIDAAVDGDVILVQPGWGGSFIVDAKALVIAADGDGTVKGVLGSFAIRNLSAAQSVVLRNFAQTPSSGFGPNASCVIEQCAGAVFVEDCVLVDGDPTLRASGVAALTLARCTIRGFEYQQVVSTSSGAALELVDANAHVQSGTLEGADGKDGVNFALQAPHPGEPALRASGASFASVVGAVLRGGDGGDGAWAHIGGCVNGADGGAAIELDGAAQAWIRDSALQAGAGGAATSACLPGGSGWPVVGAPGAWTFSTATAHRLWSTSPLREGQLGKLEILGASGAAFHVFASGAPSTWFAPAIGGAWLPTPPLVPLGVLYTPNGYGAASFTVGELGAAVSAATLYVQAVRLDAATSTAFVTNATHVVLLDSAL